MAAPGHRKPDLSGSRPNPNNGSIVLLLSLFLLLLVFFIVLNAQSVQTSQRVRTVLVSLERSFPAFFIDPRLRDEQADPLASRAGTVFAVQRLSGLGNLFATAIAVAKVDSVTPGRLLEVRLPADELFLPGTADLRPDRMGLIDRVADALLQNRPGERIELDALLSIGPAGGPSQPPGPVVRAGALARLLIADGAPTDAVTVGIERGAPGAVRLLFSLRAMDDPPGRGRR